MPTDDLPTQELVAGESRTIEGTVKENGSAKDISGASTAWFLLPDQGDPDGDAVLSDSDSGISVSIVDAANGRLDITINQGETDGLSGRYWQRIEVDDTGDGLQKWGGHVFIEAP